MSSIIHGRASSGPISEHKLTQLNTWIRHCYKQCMEQVRQKESKYYEVHDYEIPFGFTGADTIFANKECGNFVSILTKAHTFALSKLDGISNQERQRWDDKGRMKPFEPFQHYSYYMAYPQDITKKQFVELTIDDIIDDLCLKCEILKAIVNACTPSEFQSLFQSDTTDTTLFQLIADVFRDRVLCLNPQPLTTSQAHDTALAQHIQLVNPQVYKNLVDSGVISSSAWQSSVSGVQKAVKWFANYFASGTTMFAFSVVTLSHQLYSKKRFASNDELISFSHSDHTQNESLMVLLNLVIDLLQRSQTQSKLTKFRGILYLAYAGSILKECYEQHKPNSEFFNFMLTVFLSGIALTKLGSVALEVNLNKVDRMLRAQITGHNKWVILNNIVLGWHCLCEFHSIFFDGGRPYRFVSDGTMFYGNNCLLPGGIHPHRFLDASSIVGMVDSGRPDSIHWVRDFHSPHPGNNTIYSAPAFNGHYLVPSLTPVLSDLTDWSPPQFRDKLNKSTNATNREWFQNPFRGRGENKTNSSENESNGTDADREYIKQIEYWFDIFKYRFVPMALSAKAFDVGYEFSDEYLGLDKEFIKTFFVQKPLGGGGGADTSAGANGGGHTTINNFFQGSRPTDDNQQYKHGPKALEDQFKASGQIPPDNPTTKLIEQERAQKAVDMQANYKKLQDAMHADHKRKDYLQSSEYKGFADYVKEEAGIKGKGFRTVMEGATHLITSATNTQTLSAIADRARAVLANKFMTIGGEVIFNALLDFIASRQQLLLGNG